MKVVYSSENFCLSVVVLTVMCLLPESAHGRGYALFKKDKERIVALVNKFKAGHGNDLKVSWDRKLENTAGLECECGMIPHTSASWGWAVVARFQRHFNLYFGHEVGGLLASTRRTAGDPYENQWKDIKLIVNGWYKQGVTSEEHKQLLQSKRMGCAIFPTCYVGDTTLMTVLTCVFAPKASLGESASAPVPGSGTEPEPEGSGEVAMADSPNSSYIFSELKKDEGKKSDDVEDEGYMKTGIKILNKKL